MDFLRRIVGQCADVVLKPSPPTLIGEPAVTYPGSSTWAKREEPCGLVASSPKGGAKSQYKTCAILSRHRTSQLLNCLHTECGGSPCHPSTIRPMPAVIKQSRPHQRLASPTGWTFSIILWRGYCCLSGQSSA